jgi:hypothetical protein
MLAVAFKLFIFGFLTTNLHYQDPRVLPQANANVDVTFSYPPANAKVDLLLDYPPARVINFGITLGGVVGIGGAGAEGEGHGDGEGEEGGEEGEGDEGEN